MTELREALEDAYIEEPDESTQPEETGQETSQEETPAVPEVPAATGEDTGAGAGDPKPAEPAPADGTPAAASDDGPKPPIDWNPELRESWKDLPAGVRDKIAKREADIAQAMQGTAEARRTHQDISQLAQTYGSVMAAEGVQDPMQAIQGLFQTATQLRMGSPQQKAEKIADMIMHYGVDIQALDNLLVGNPATDPQVNQMEQMIDQRMGPVNQMMNNLAGMQQNTNVQQQQSVRQEVDQFATTAEFMQDVRVDMADIMDMATKRGQNLTLQQAYDKACQLHPGVSKVIAQRAEQQQLAAAGQNMQAKRSAASSITGKGQSNPTQGVMTMADQLNAAWDAHAG